MRVVGRTALIVLAALLSLCMAEFVLRIGTGRPLPPLFVAGDDGRLHVNPERAEVAPGSAAARPDALRIVWLGDSTAMGVPFDPQLSPPRWLEWILASRGVRAEVVGVAGPGLAAAEVGRLLHDSLELQPDVLVVTTGHNEYLATGAALRPRWWHAFALGRMFLHSLPPGSEPPRPGETPDHEAVTARFARALATMVGEAAGAGVPLLFTEPVCNLADMPPVLGGGASDADAAFAAGRVVLQAGDVAAALTALRRARDLDRWPHRATSALEAEVRRAAPHLVPLQEVFVRASATGIPGRDLFVDHCHPDPSGQRLIALAVADSIEDLRVAPASGRRGQAPPVADGLAALGADAGSLAQSRARAGRVLAGLALLREQPGALAEEAARVLLQPTLDAYVGPGELASSRTLLALARHDAGTAREQLALTQPHPEALGRLRALVSRHAWVAEAFRRQGLEPP